MMKLRSVTAGAIATAMLATSAAPAMAQGYPGSGYGYHGYGQQGYGDRYRRRDHHDNTGAVVAGVVGVGILAAIIASASSKSRNDNRYSYNNGYRGSINSESSAADACANAAQAQLGQGERIGVDNVYRTGDGFSVTGTADARGHGNGYGNGYGRDDTKSFRCTVRYGSVERVDFNGYGYGR